MGAILDEVVGPDVVWVFGPQSDAGPVRQPEPSAFGLLVGNPQPLAPPDPLDPLVVDHPARGRAQQLRDLPVAVAAVLPGERDDIGGEPLLVLLAPRLLALRRAVLAKGRAGTTLGDMKLPSNVLDAGATTRGAQ
jgi:hypothetical protein